MPSSRSPPWSSGRAPGHPVRRRDPDVPVQEAGKPRDALTVDGGHRRNHRRCHHPGGRALEGGATWARARRGPWRHARSASCSRKSGVGVITWWGIRDRATTRPSPSTATALAAVVPTSIPMVHRSPAVGRCVLLVCSPRCDGMGRPPRVGATVPVGQNATQGRGSTYAEATTQGAGHGRGRGPGLDLLGELADLTLDSWLDQPTLRIYDAAQLAERMQAEGATIAVVESDRCAGPLFELPSSPCAAAGVTRTMSTWRRPPRPGYRCSGHRDATPTRWPS